VAETSALERLLRRDRLIVAASLAALAALAWVYLLTGAGMGAGAWEMTRLSLFPHRLALSPATDVGAMTMGGMSMGDMPMQAGSPEWSPQTWLLAVAMWSTMMVAMMAPSAAPMILLYAKVRRHALSQGRDAGGLAPNAVFAAGYLIVWLAFSLAAASLQGALEASTLVSATLMSSASRWLSAGVLIAAGLYQFSPLKTLCLTQCRAPAGFLSRHWRPGAAGALRLGILHGAYCLGCCWALMALLFVGGVMNLAWIAALALLVTAEKLLPAGPWVARVAGALLVAWGLATTFA
jgi:predicted metal-binding membrane protein